MARTSASPSFEVELTTTSAISPSAWLWPLRPLCRYSTMSSALHDAVVQRPAQRRRTARIAQWRQRREVGPDRQDVAADHFREIGIGECRVITRAVRRHAVADRADEIVVAPCAEAGIAVRRQV